MCGRVGAASTQPSSASSLSPARQRSDSRSIPTSTARSVRSSSQSISSSAKARLSGLAPELSDPVGPLEVGEHQGVEQLGAGRPEGVQALMELALELVGTHGTETAQSRGLQSTEVAPQAIGRP